MTYSKLYRDLVMPLTIISYLKLLPPPRISNAVPAHTSKDEETSRFVRLQPFFRHVDAGRTYHEMKQQYKESVVYRNNNN